LGQGLGKPAGQRQIVEILEDLAVFLPKSVGQFKHVVDNLQQKLELQNVKACAGQQGLNPKSEIETSNLPQSLGQGCRTKL
jgi:hypothetical protein